MEPQLRHIIGCVPQHHLVFLPFTTRHPLSWQAVLGVCLMVSFSVVTWELRQDLSSSATANDCSFQGQGFHCFPLGGSLCTPLPMNALPPFPLCSFSCQVCVAQLLVFWSLFHYILPRDNQLNEDSMQTGIWPEDQIWWQVGGVMSFWPKSACISQSLAPQWAWLKRQEAGPLPLSPLDERWRVWEFVQGFERQVAGGYSTVPLSILALDYEAKCICLLSGW